ARAAADLAAAGPRRRRRPAAPALRGPRLLALLAAIGRRLGVLPAPADLDARLAAAGTPAGLRARDLMAVKGGAALAALLGAVPVLTAGPPRLAPALAAGAAAAGWLAPDAWLRRRARRRARTIARELSGVLDLLRVAVEAGLPVARAAAEVGARHRGLLARELAAVAATTALGVPREQALARLAAAAPLPAVAALVAAIGRSERHGAPLGPALAALAADARAEHARALAEQAARAAPKIQLAVALLLVPAVMLLVAAAVLRGMGVV
ncbi:MAG: type II secretion system F family protein, partial [Solirubrobacteraceae bacterium]|nr:type II secretion system F family protein [Solirubrobacteraceae bacterium]